LGIGGEPPPAEAFRPCRESGDKVCLQHVQRRPVRSGVHLSSCSKGDRMGLTASRLRCGG
ncbi:MAG: hypothetical protein QMC09_06615, partial [Thauera sp.]